MLSARDLSAETEELLTWVAKRRFVTSKHLVVVTHPGGWSIVALLAVESVLTTQFFEDLAAVLLRFLRRVCSILVTRL